MNMRVGVVAAVLLAQAAAGVAGTFPGSTARTPLAVGSVSDRLSVGIGFDRIERGVELKGGPEGVLKAESLSGYAGFDVQPWLTAFVTVGGVELKDTDSSTGLKVSGGVSAYLWEVDVLTPVFMAGRVTLKATAELARFAPEISGGDVTWMEGLVALPIGYEKFDNYPTGASGVETSLALYAGPALSYMEGSVKSPFGKQNFEGKEVFGFVAGADVYISPQFSIGAKLLAFDEISYGASVRFHF